jgi:galactose mutarotase-like enzyme
MEPKEKVSIKYDTTEETFPIKFHFRIAYILIRKNSQCHRIF